MTGVCRGTSLELVAPAVKWVDLIWPAGNRIWVAVEKTGVMRKRHRVLIFVALVAALVVPVGYALSVESPAPARVRAGYATDIPARALSEIPAVSVVATPVTISLNGAASAAPSSALPFASDSVKLFGIGTLLFGLAAFVRKAR